MQFHEGCLWLAGGRDSQGLPNQRLFCLDLESLSGGFSPRKVAARCALKSCVCARGQLQLVMSCKRGLPLIMPAQATGKFQRLCCLGASCFAMSAARSASVTARPGLAVTSPQAILKLKKAHLAIGSAPRSERICMLCECLDHNPAQTCTDPGLQILPEHVLMLRRPSWLELDVGSPFGASGSSICTFDQDALIVVQARVPLMLCLATSCCHADCLCGLCSTSHCLSS